MTISAIDSSMGKMEFLNLLATQLSNQNPMEPMDNSQFIAQLAQFSALEAAENTNENIETLVSLGVGNQAESMLGRTVTGTLASDGSDITGVVTAVDFTSGSPVLTVNGKEIALSEIKTISE